MTIDLDAYDANKKFVLDWFNTRGNRDISNTISTMGFSTMTPCIVIAFWLGPETNWDPNLINTIKSLTRFYGYTDIRNKPEGCPPL